MGVNIEKVFGENVFDDSVMKVRLPKSDFERVKTLMHEGGEITEDLADVVAQAMKEWALEKGATHYTHVFQPYVISVGAEKHDSFAFMMFRYLRFRISGLHMSRYGLLV